MRLSPFVMDSVSTRRLRKVENGGTMVAGRSADFRNKAAVALRLGRHATSIDDRDAHFEMAASYKALANDVEWFRGERQRSYKRKKKPKAFD